MASNFGDSSHGGHDDVENTQSRNRSEQSKRVNGGGGPQNSLSDPQFIGLVGDEVGVEDHVQRDEDSCVSKEGNVAQLNCSDPFKDTSVLVDHFSLFKVEGFRRKLSWHLHKRLISESRVENILLKLKQTIKWSSEEFRMTKTISNVVVLLFWSNGNVVFVAFGVIVIPSYGAVVAFFFPFEDMFEGNLFVPGSISDESVFVGKSPFDFFVDVPPLESKISLRCFDRTIRV